MKQYHILKMASVGQTKCGLSPTSNSLLVMCALILILYAAVRSGDGGQDGSAAVDGRSSR